MYIFVRYLSAVQLLGTVVLLMSTECAVGRLAVDRDGLVRRKARSGKRINQPKVETIGLVIIMKCEYVVVTIWIVAGTGCVQFPRYMCFVFV